jgi:tetratricopeptide (TPR) repeat protein
MSAGRRDEHIALLREEIADLDRQVEDGDIDATTAAALRSKYTTELERQLPNPVEGSPEATTGEGGPEGSDGNASRSDGDRRPGRLSGRVLAGAAVVGVAIVAIGVFAVVSLDQGRTAGVEGVAGDALGVDGGVDLSTITNEQMEEVVAQNPDVVGMRLALARRYFEGGEFDRALDHYFEVLEREQHPEALANIGWMTYLSGRPDIAVGYLEAALQRRPDYLPAQWFTANVYVTLGRNAEARVFLVDLEQSDEVPDEIAQGVQDLLAQIDATP